MRQQQYAQSCDNIDHLFYFTLQRMKHIKHKSFWIWSNRFFTVMLFAVLPHFVYAMEDAFWGRWFCDSTLRVDYTFTGDALHQYISLDEIRSSEGWYGRRVNMKVPALRGNGMVKMTDVATGDTLFCTSFSTLFQEWQTTEEATRHSKSFENVFLFPMPRRDAQIEVALYDTHNRQTARFTHLVTPSDILIRPIDAKHAAPHRSIFKGGDSKGCIDVAIVAEGYTEAERELFYKDAETICREIMRYSPFSEHHNDFNFTAVALESRESGVSIPHEHLWKNTALGASFDTFYSQRYLTTLRLKKLHDSLAGIPYEHIIILANTDNYGGGGIYNSYTLSAAHNPLCLPVTVHEFGHSFGGLGDEYFYDDQYEQFYFPGIEPWEQNLTTLAEFEKKWQDMLPDGTSIPTQCEGLAENDMEHIGVYEGGGYQSKGVYRAFIDCRMKTNNTKRFCAVCERAINRIIAHQTVPMEQSHKR